MVNCYGVIFDSEAENYAKTKQITINELRNYIQMKIKILLHTFLLSALLIIISCKEDPPVIVEDLPVVSDYGEGVYIVNEGLFNTGTGAITFMNRDGSDLQHNIYQQANNSLPLGNVAQSMNRFDNKAFIMINNADKVEVVDIFTFQRIKTLLNITYPAYAIKADDNKVYISSWGNKLFVVYLDILKAVGIINTGTGPTKMLRTGDEVWVLNQGGLGVDSTISVVNVSTDEVAQTIQVYSRPTGIQKDKNGNIWVMCSGKGYWQGNQTKGHLVCIDPLDYSFINDIEFPDTTNHPEKLVINSGGDVLYYNYPGGIYKFEISSSGLDTEAFISHSSMFYGLGLDTVDNVIYASDALDYAQDGLVFRYNAATGIIIDSLYAGIIPGEFYFTE